MTNTEIYNKYYEQVFGHILYYVKNYHDAQDVTQDVFKKIVSLNLNEATCFNPFKYEKKKKARISTWIRTITFSVIIDFFRTNHQEKFIAVSDFVNDDGNDAFQFNAGSNKTPEKAMEIDELRAKILKSFRELKPRHRKIAKMYFMNEMSYKEISEELDIPMGTVKGLLSRARQVLQKELSSMYKTEEEVIAVN